MLQLALLLLLHAVAVVGLVSPVPSQPCSSLGTFKNPSARCQPRFRYWLPDSGVDPEIVAANIEDSGEHGAGGVEFVPFYNYGGEAGDPPAQVDWVANELGTSAFRNVFRTTLQTHKDSGLLMDFAMGPNQGQGVPASSDDRGLQWDLVSYSEEIAVNKEFHGQIPGWGTVELVAVVSAHVLHRQMFRCRRSIRHSSRLRLPASA